MKCLQFSNDQAANNVFRLRFFSSSDFTIERKSNYKISSAGGIKFNIQCRNTSITECDCACLS